MSVFAAPARAEVQQAGVRVAAQSFLEGRQVLGLRGASELSEHGGHVTLNPLKQDQTSPLGIKNKRLKAGWDETYLQTPLTQLIQSPE